MKKCDKVKKPYNKQSLHKVIKRSVNLMKNSVYSNNPHITDDLKMAIIQYILNADRAVLNTVFENTVRRVNKCMVTGGGHFEHYL
jgi:23S rRNA maturation-related 3'-5' exoribonuclease YhaM